MVFKRQVVALTAAAALLFSATAFAQYSSRPFFEQSLVQSQAFGLEVALQRLTALELAVEDSDDGLDDDFFEVVEGFEEDLPRFMGTLSARDAALAEALAAAVEEVEEAAEGGGDLSAAIAEARELLTQAYDLVIPADVRSDPVFIAALIVDLSLGDVGVGEGYEEAVEGELGAYTMGYVALDRVTELWGEIAGNASEQQRADIDEMLEFIETLYPEPLIEEAIIGNPEEAEAPVQRMIGVLESVVDAELFAGRDMAALAAHLPEELVGACQAYEAGEDARALETVIAVGSLYLNADLGDFLEFMAPEVHDEAVELIGALTGLSGEEEDEDEEGEGDEEEEEVAQVVADSSAACRELLAALQEASGVLGG